MSVRQHKYGRQGQAQTYDDDDDEGGDYDYSAGNAGFSGYGANEFVEDGNCRWCFARNFDTHSSCVFLDFSDDDESEDDDESGEEESEEEDEEEDEKKEEATKKSAK